MQAWRQTGRDYGKAFEAQIMFWAAREGILIESNGLKVRVLRGGKTVAIKSNLDFHLLKADGQFCFADAKSFAANHFVYSQLTPHQVERAFRYEQHHCRAGFVVQFRESARCSYFPASLILRKGARSRFAPDDGIDLGTARHMSLDPIFTSTKA